MPSDDDRQGAARTLQRQFLDRIAPNSHFHLLLDQIEGLHFFAKDRSGRMMFVSRNSLTRHGLINDWEIVGKNDADIVPPSLALTYVADDQRVYRTGEAIRNKVELWLNPQGVPDWYLTTKIPIRAHSGDIIGIMGILQSYESRKQQLAPYLSIADAVEFVNHNYGTHLSVSELARRCHLSVRQCERKFLEAFRMTPREFIAHIRIQSACEALLQPRRSIAEIALDTGFTDQSAFTRQFRKQMGITPRQYRQRCSTPAGAN